MGQASIRKIDGSAPRGISTKDTPGSMVRTKQAKASRLFGSLLGLQIKEKVLWYFGRQPPCAADPPSPSLESSGDVSFQMISTRTMGILPLSVNKFFPGQLAFNCTTRFGRRQFVCPHYFPGLSVPCNIFLTSKNFNGSDLDPPFQVFFGTTV